MTPETKLRKLRRFIAHVEEVLAQVERAEPSRAEIVKTLAQLRLEAVFAIQEADK
jgi:hypothetical protein